MHTLLILKVVPADGYNFQTHPNEKILDLPPWCIIHKYNLPVILKRNRRCDHTNF